MSAPATEGLADVDQATFANIAEHGQFRAVCPDWRNENVSSLGLTSLTNPVHPVLQLQSGRFAEETLPARRLATRILEADCMLPFWWTVLFSPANDSTGDLEARRARASEVPIFDFGYKPTPEETERFAYALERVEEEESRVRFYDPEPYDTMTSDQIEKTKAALRDLASCVVYRYGASIQHLTQGMDCVTMWFLRTPCSLPGAPSMILISPEELSAYCTAMRGDPVCQAWATISLGIKFAQQIAHAAVGAGHPGADLNWTNQYRYYADEIPGSEIRMLEACLFGGVLRKELDEAHDPPKSHYTIDGEEGSPGLWFAYSDWPSADVIAGCGTISWYDDEREQQEEGPFFHREWHVPFSWLLTVVTDKFWDEVREKGILAMRPRQEIGYVMSRDGQRKYGPHHAEELRGQIAPSGYSHVPRSYLMVSNELYQEACGLVLFGGFNAVRAPIMNANQSPDSGGSASTDDTSMGDGSEHGDATDDIPMTDGSEDGEESDDESMSEDSAEEDDDDEEDDDSE